MYYIDFDNTLFNTHKYGIELVSNLHEKALQYLVPDTTDVEKIEIINNPTIEYYFSKATELSQKYNISYEVLEKALQDILTKETIKYKPILEKYNISYKTLDQILFEKFTTNTSTEELAKQYNLPNEILLDELITATKTDTSNYPKILGHLYETAIQLVLLSKETNYEFIETNNSNSSIANFFLMAQNLSTKYDIPYEILEKELINTMQNDSKFTFDDTIKFLKSLRNSGERICILTHVALQQDHINSNNSFLQSNLAQQIFKLTGSGILDFVDEVYITTLRKYYLDLDYQHNDFIDDDPKDLKGLLYKQHINSKKQLNLQYINFNNLYDVKNYYNQTMENLINIIVEKTSISYEEVKKQVNFDLNSPNFEIIIDCLSAKFKISKQILRNVVDSTLRQKSINSEQSIQQVDDNQNCIITAYGVKCSNIKQQLLLIAYSGKLPLAKGIFITDQRSINKEQTNRKGTITRIKKQFDFKRISSSISNPFTGIEKEQSNGALPSPEEIPTYTSLTDIPIQTLEKTFKKED